VVFYYGTSLVDIYFTRNIRKAGVDCEGDAETSPIWEARILFSEIRKAVEVAAEKKKKLRTEGDEEISKTQTASTNILLLSPAYTFTFIPRKSYPHPCLSQASYNP